MYKIIIFEGPDCSGKSTIKSALEKHTNYKHLCVDRMFITSLVYNKIINRNKDIEHDILRDLNEFANLKPIFIHVITDPDTIWNRINRRGDDMLTTEALVIKICAEYKRVFKSLEDSIDIIEVFGNEPVLKSVERIVDGIRKRYK